MTVELKHDFGLSSFRCPICGRGQPANLLIGGSPLAVRVADRFPEGFSVVAEGRPPIEVGAVIQLRSAEGWYEVRVTEVAAQEPANDDWEGRSSGLFQVGLHEIREYRDPAFEGGGGLGGKSSLVPDRLSASWLFAVVRWFLWAFSIVGLPLVAVALFWYSDAIVNWYQTWRAGFRRADAAATGSASAEDRLREAVRLPGAAVFTVPEVARELELTDAQQEEIRRIVAMTEDAFRVLDPKVQKAGRQAETEIGRKVLDAARHEALRVLTPEQRRRWDALAGLKQAGGP